MSFPVFKKMEFLWIWLIFIHEYLMILYDFFSRGIYFAKYYGYDGVGGGKWLLGKKNENWGFVEKNEKEGKRKKEKNGLKTHL